jgi:hypothetical protein
MGLPVLHRSSSCMHAVAITPVEPQGASFVHYPCSVSLPRNFGGSASTSRLSRPAQRSLTLRPAYSPSHLHDPLHRRLQPLRYLYDCSDCCRLERKLPGGIRTTERPCLRTAHKIAYVILHYRHAQSPHKCERFATRVRRLGNLGR